jgi:hypothetical protein
MAFTHPSTVGLKVRPEEHDPDMIGAYLPDGIKIARYVPGFKRIPTVPPLLAGNIIYTEADFIERFQLRALV